MCGIAGFHIKDKAKGMIEAGYLMDWLLTGIEHRGREATGFLALGFDGKVTVDKAPVPASEFMQKRKAIPSAPRSVLGHTRLATQGDPKFAENNHPVHYGTAFVTHNGWIVNDDELFRTSQMERTAEVDTIAIPAMLWNNNESGFTPEGVVKALESLHGAMAIAAADITQPDVLLLARGNSSPLFFFENDKIVIWASSIFAIQTAWGKVFGTPPKKERFQEFAEGEFRLIKAGKTTHVGTFEPGWGTRYNYGYSSYTEPVNSFGYSTRGSEDSDWFSHLKNEQDKQDELDANGTWLTLPDGSRTFMPVGSGDTGARMPDASELEIVRSMKDWAKIDATAHENTVYDLANILQIDMMTVAWLLYYVDDDTLKANKSLSVTRAYLESKYGELYNMNIDSVLEDGQDTPPVPATIVMCSRCEKDEADQGSEFCQGCKIVMKYLAPKEPASMEGVRLLEAANLDVSEEGKAATSWECIRCQENETEDFVDFYCGSCILEMSAEYKNDEVH